MLQALLPEFLRSYPMRFRDAERRSRALGLVVEPRGPDAVEPEDASVALDRLSDWIAACMLHFGERGRRGAQDFAASAAEVCEAMAHGLRAALPRLPVAVTVGDVHVAGRPLSGFDAPRFASHLHHGRGRADAHAWLTLGDALVLDATLASRLHAAAGSPGFGGVLAGLPGALDYVELPGVAGRRPDFGGPLDYRPVAVGTDALAVATGGARAARSQAARSLDAA